jgi:hypothetical protein
MLAELDTQPRTTRTRTRPARAGRPVERVIIAARLEQLDPDTLGDLIGAVDDRLEAISDAGARARLERGRARLELALADALDH